MLAIVKEAMDKEIRTLQKYKKQHNTYQYMLKSKHMEKLLINIVCLTLKILHIYHVYLFPLHPQPFSEKNHQDRLCVFLKTMLTFKSLHILNMPRKSMLIKFKYVLVKPVCTQMQNQNGRTLNRFQFNDTLSISFARNISHFNGLYINENWCQI